MQKDPYLTLGVSRNSTEQEIESAYREKREYYSKLRFEEGEVGLNASKVIGELDKAYSECMSDINSRVSAEKFGNQLGYIEQLIKENKIEEAQEKLDEVETRDAEWHFVQARIYYVKQWFNESKSQLQMALDLEPGNEKYVSTMQKLNQRITANTDTTKNASFNNNAQANNTNNAQNNNRAGYQKQDYNQRASNESACCNTCQCLICTDCCCECFGGDLIPCC